MFMGDEDASWPLDSPLKQKATMDRPMLRGIFAFEDEETPEWRQVVLNEGAGGVPKFATKSECEDFIRKHCWRGSNPDYPKLQHVFSMLMDWKQIKEILLPKIEEYDRRYPPQPPKEISPDNRFLQGIGKGVLDGVDVRVDLPFHKMTTRQSTLNTLKYLFFHMRCGIFVMIRQRKVVLFVPFCNKDYTNNWGHLLKFDSSNGTMYQYYQEKSRHFRRENIIQDPMKWWANGNIMCNEHCRYRNKQDETQYWGDQFLTQLRDMLEDSCKHRDIPDCEFFINKRDYPHLKENLGEPYGFLFDKDDRNPDDDVPLTRYKYETYAPIMSFYVSKRFADIPFPCSEDWEAATGLVFPQSFRHTHCDNCQCGNPVNCENMWECFCEWAGMTRKPHGVENAARDLFTASNFKKFEKPWGDKVNTAFFRGSATGGGTTIETNQRLHLAHLSNTWKEDDRYNGTESGDGVPYLDAEVTTWNVRDKKIAGKPMTYIRRDQFIFQAGRQHFIPIYEQSRYKYILYVEGHCAANRYAFLMRLGCVILKVTSRCVADEMWYYPVLKPFEDHVPIKEDLSDLAEKIQWCRENDDKCQQIAERASELYDQYISKPAIHDYMEVICNRIAQRFQPAPAWFNQPEDEEDIRKPEMRVSHNHTCVGDDLCRRCRELKQEGDSRRSYDSRSYNDDDRGGGRFGGGKRFRGGGYNDHRRSDRGGGGYRNNNSHNNRDRSDSYQDRFRPSSPRNSQPQCKKCRRPKAACRCNTR